MTYDPQPIKPADIICARVWKSEHSNHVARLIEGAEHAYPPSGSDCLYPELWTGAHWKWLVEGEVSGK